MMNLRKLIIILNFIPLCCFGQQLNNELKIVQLSDNVYEHISLHDLGGRWGKVSSNGLIVVSDGKALMVDTPMDSLQTGNIYHFIQDSLQAELISFIPGHWHDDCTAGMEYLKNRGVETYANRETNDILTAKGLVAAHHSFTDSLELQVGSLKVHSYFLGGGHATDNVVVWIPKDEVLFGGCMVKDVHATHIGNLSDASPFEEWLATIVKLEQKFPQAKCIVPGHGDTGGKELLEHTGKMLIGLMEE